MSEAKEIDALLTLDFSIWTFSVLFVLALDSRGGLYAVSRPVFSGFVDLTGPGSNADAICEDCGRSMFILITLLDGDKRRGDGATTELERIAEEGIRR